MNTVHDGDEIQAALLVSIDTGEYDAQTSLDELAELAATAGAEVRGTVTQKRDAPDKATCIGSGRLEEIAEICRNAEIPLIIFDRELSSTQLRNIEDATGCRIIDRTMLILDIFAGRARSAEGRLQVELAQLQYLLPRLAGKGTALSRLGAGIGTRGPGETKLETDKRHIKRKITGNRPQAYQKADTGAEGTASAGRAPPRDHAGTPPQGRNQNGGDRRLYQRGQVHPDESADRRGRAGRG